jgi:hypothetical protein
MTTTRFICALALPVGLLLASLNGAGAQSSQPAQGSQAARDACTPDAVRLCKEFIPDQAKVRACILSKQSQLSEACRLAMAPKPAETARAEPRRPHYTHHVRHRRYHDDCCDC